MAPLSPVFALALQLPLFIAAADGFPFIIFFLTLGQAQLHFDILIPEEEFEGDQGKALFFGLADEAFDLPAMQEEFTGAGGIVGVLGSIRIGTDMGVVEEDLPLADAGKGIINVHLAHPDGFDFGAGQDNAGFHHIVNEIVKIGLAVLADNFYLIFFHGLASRHMAAPQRDSLLGRVGQFPAEHKDLREALGHNSGHIGIYLFHRAILEGMAGELLGFLHGGVADDALHYRNG